MILFLPIFLQETAGFLPDSRLWQLAHFKIGRPYFVKLRRKREFLFVRKSRISKKISARNIQFFFFLRTLMWGSRSTPFHNIMLYLNNALNLTSTYIFGISISLCRSSNFCQFFLRYRLYSIPVDYRFLIFNFNIFFFQKFQHNAFLSDLRRKFYWHKPRTLFRLHLKYNV